MKKKNRMDTWLAWLRRNEVWLGFVLLSAILLGILLAWSVIREPLPDPIRFATAREEGFFRIVGEALKEPLEIHLDKTVELLDTEGSVDNAGRLLSKDAELAILSEGTSPTKGLGWVVPLYLEPTYVIVRGDSGINSMRDLRGKRIILGPAKSGMRDCAKQILKHYGLDSSDVEKQADAGLYFTDLATMPDLDGAIVTIGATNKGLNRIMSSGDFRLLDLETEALVTKYPHFHSAGKIPKGFFRAVASDAPIPMKSVDTVLNIAYLAVNIDAPSLLVTETLDVLYQEDLTREIPTLIPRGVAADWDSTYPRHEAAHGFFNPQEGLHRQTVYLEFIVAVHGTFVAVVSILFLAWRRQVYIRREQDTLEVDLQKQSLDAYLDVTLEIEKKQMHETDPVRLKELLDEVTLTKLKALDELTSHALRGDRIFLIFLTQCGNLAQKIQLRLDRVSEPPKKKIATKRSKPSPKRRPKAKKASKKK